MERKLLGMVEVDSGSLVVGDPTYFLPDATRGRAGVDFHVVIDADPSIPAVHLAGTPAMLIQSFGGDGSYPVYGEFDGSHLASLTVEFVDPDDD